MNINKELQKPLKRENNNVGVFAFILTFFTLVLEENTIWELKHYAPSIKTDFNFADIFVTLYYSLLHSQTKKRLLH